MVMLLFILGSYSSTLYKKFIHILIRKCLTQIMTAENKISFRSTYGIFVEI